MEALLTLGYFLLSLRLLRWARLPVLPTLLRAGLLTLLLPALLHPLLLSPMGMLMVGAALVLGIGTTAARVQLSSRRSSRSRPLGENAFFFLATNGWHALIFMSAHLTLQVIACSTRISGQGNHPSNHHTARLTAGLTALTWAIYLTLFFAMLTGWHTLILPMFVFSLPLSLTIGWHIWRWSEAHFWANHPGTLVLGQQRTPDYSITQPYTVSADQRTKHLWVLGPTGAGKSTLLQNLILSDIQAGAGVCVVDPKDNLIDGILPHIPPAREKDVILLDLGDREYPLGFNPLAGIPASRRSLATSELITVLQRYYASSWGSRMEYVLTNVILALLEARASSFLDISRLLLEPSFRKGVIQQVRNPAVHQFFTTEFEEILRHERKALQPILNKIQPWLAYPELRNIVGQSTSSFSMREVMDAQKILFVRIPKGLLGEASTSLLAALITAKLQLAAHSRVDTPLHRRRFFTLYADEFQLYANSSFITMLTESRAFRLGLVCANQYAEQLSPELRLALQKNVATTVECQQQGREYQLSVTRLENGEQSEPALLTPAPPLPAGIRQRERAVRSRSQAQYGRPRKQVEQDILDRFFSKPPNQGGTNPPASLWGEGTKPELDEE